MRYPPLRPTASIRGSKISETAKTCFSPMHRRLLSNAAPKMIEAAAFSRSAVASTTTGGLPGPATIARRLLPERGPRHGRAAGHDQELHAAILEQRRRRIRAWAGR